MGTPMSMEQETVRTNLLIVEDDADIRVQMMWALKADYAVLEATDRQTAISEIRREAPALVLLDLGLPPDTGGVMEGLATLHEILHQSPTTKVIVVTGNSERANALAAIEGGAYDFIEKPVQLEVLKVILQRAAYLSCLERENRELQMRVGEGGFEDILGVSPVVQEIFETIRRVASSEVSVLITGESGTGKELVARAIHRRSMRKGGPFIAINCAAIPETLLESELFGHEKGAFTGAYRQQKGKLEYANGGTLFLDEVGQMPLGLQVKLLRFLQDGQMERVGGRESIVVDTRVLAATNSALQDAMQKGQFRDDLFYRLSTVEIRIPPLRERGEDVILLASTFLRRYRNELNSRVTGYSVEAKEAIRKYPWPGNVREMENRIKRAILMATTPTIEPAHLDLPRVTGRKPKQTLKAARAQLDKEIIQSALIGQHGNVSKAAEDLGISRQALHDYINKYSLGNHK